ncbi:hypothetical protein [Sneathiella sp. HT1-7]|uniref:hypothetical protein n=1 Tax=Sneathiella sp. HT1-7 TaxID=2887192 RepID=UPI001D136C06|nr:hypothetical protein [Sneathiella sp. HT1-7]MCC3306734.1 hypothetical protein [Sneathiella sp. HT1-7]
MTQKIYTKARYIKLGARGGWEQHCLEKGIAPLAYYDVPHEMALASDREAIRKINLDLGKTAGTATGHANQILGFYDPDPDVLWITFSGGSLWWAELAPDVEYLGSDPEEFPQGSRFRRTVSGWHRVSFGGTPLLIGELSGNLTKVAAYQGTICTLKPDQLDYLLRKLKDEDLPEITVAQDARRQLLATVEDVIQLLTWQDFELFTELLFSRSGWQRVSSLGGTQKTLDLELLLPTTGERAVVQVKSATSQAQLDDYIGRFNAMPADKYFYVYHTSKHTLDPRDSDIFLMGASALADQALKSGLVDWLIKKAA